jgi:hypothetical protein
MTAEERKEKEQELRGYVDGICECANIVKQKDLPLAGSMLKDLRITKELAQKYAKPETFNEMKKDIYAPKIEQKLERNNTRGRGM